METTVAKPEQAQGMTVPVTERSEMLSWQQTSPVFKCVGGILMHHWIFSVYLQKSVCLHVY